METVLLNGYDFNIEDITFQENITKLSNGSKHIGMGYKKKILTLQTPLMKVPFGINCNDKFDIPKYSLEVSFNNMENKEIKKFYNNIVRLDKKNLKEGIINSKKWFKLDNTNKDIIKELYNKQIKRSKNKKGEILTQYPSRFRIKLPYDIETEQFDFDIVDNKGDNIEGDITKILGKGSSIRCIIQCVGLWISNNSYTCQWKMKRMECIPFINKPIDFLEDSD